MNQVPSGALVTDPVQVAGLVEFPWVAVDERVGDLFPMDEVG